MNRILSYKKFVNESFPVAFADPMYGSDIFKIRYRQINDLSSKSQDKVNAKPVNDLLDGYGVGDVVRGKGIDSGSYHEGNIVSIEKDEEGENIAISIEYEGAIVPLAPATVSFVDQGNKGNRARTQIDSDQTDLSGEYGEFFNSTTYESKDETK